MKTTLFQTRQGWKRITSEWVQGKLWVHFKGEIRVIDPEASRKKFSGGSKLAAGSITAPMPGKVTKVFVQQGQTVEAGQAMLVMEAMKMEYTLKAEISGQVQEVKAKEGQQVALGQLLVKVE